MTKWKEGSWEKLKARALGTYIFLPNQFGEHGPQPEHIGYVITEDFNVNDMDSVAEKFYRVVFEEYPGQFFIGLEYSGTFTPYQKQLFTSE